MFLHANDHVAGIVFDSTVARMDKYLNTISYDMLNILHMIDMFHMLMSVNLGTRWR